MSTVLGGNNGKWQPGVLIVGYEKYPHHKQERGINVFLRIKPHASTLSHPYIPTARWDENPNDVMCIFLRRCSLNSCGLVQGLSSPQPTATTPDGWALPSSLRRVFKMQNKKWLSTCQKCYVYSFGREQWKVTTWGFDCGVWKISTSQAREG